jgi:glucose-6-phosphate 1-dehydrogenase
MRLPNPAPSRNRGAGRLRGAVVLRRRGFSADSPGSLLDVIGRAHGSLGGDPQLVHYLAVPPVPFGGLAQALGQPGLSRGSRVVYEKPFGTSGDAFRELDRVVHSVLDECRVARPKTALARLPAP